MVWFDVRDVQSTVKWWNVQIVRESRNIAIMFILMFSVLKVYQQVNTISTDFLNKSTNLN